MKAYYYLLMDIHKVAKQENAPLGEITQIMEDIGEWAKAASQRIMATKFSRPEDEENTVSVLGDALLDLFAAFGTEPLQIENGASFKYGTVFNADDLPLFTIHGAEFYTEDGEKYDRISQIPVGVVCFFWYNNNPFGSFIKLPRTRTGEIVLRDIPMTDFNNN